MKTIRNILLPLTLVFFMGCSPNEDVPINNENASIQVDFNSIFGSNPEARTGRGMLWADCTKYGVIATPAHFNSSSGPFDELYATSGSFMDGFGAISESKPGDQDYNGGRWHVNMLKETVDPSVYENACSVEDLDINDFESTSTYFECPLIRYRMN